VDATLPKEFFKLVLRMEIVGSLVLPTDSSLLIAATATADAAASASASGSIPPSKTLISPSPCVRLPVHLNKQDTWG
jgi:hypothetical protein